MKNIAIYSSKLSLRLIPQRGFFLCGGDTNGFGVSDEPFKEKAMKVVSIDRIPSFYSLVIVPDGKGKAECWVDGEFMGHSGEPTLLGNAVSGEITHKEAKKMGIEWVCVR